MSRAAAYIARTAAEPLIWSNSDCFCWPASLVCEVTGRDPAAEFRGTYRTAWECRQIVLRAGGLLTLARRHLAWLPAGGDSDGVCVARVGGQTIGGILSGGRLFLKANPGVLTPAEFKILERWSL